MPKKLSEKQFDLTSTTLLEAQAYLMSKARGKDGSTCPCCRQKVKVYDREINALMARVLIILYRHAEKDTESLHVSSYLDDLSRQLGTVIRGGDWLRLRYWDLIETDGTKRAGFWKITSKGQSFVKLDLKIPKYVLTYNDKFLGYVPGSSEVTVVECLGQEFNYDELLSGKYADLLMF